MKKITIRCKQTKTVWTQFNSFHEYNQFGNKDLIREFRSNEGKTMATAFYPGFYDQYDLLVG